MRRDCPSRNLCGSDPLKLDHPVTRAQRKKQMKNKAVANTDYDLRWAAVVARDAAHDGRFVYSVATTGVYCRPSCASRLARRENVRFHVTSADAESQGFRACKRCKPDQLSLYSDHAAKVAQACRIIEASEATPSLSDLAASVNMSAFHFHRIFKGATGITPKAYATAHRRTRVRESLANSTSVTNAIYDSGFHSNAGFYANAGDMIGMTPTAYRKRGLGEQIWFAIAPCSLGVILVAITVKGICALFIGDDGDALLRDLQDRFASAQISRADNTFDKLVSKVVGLVERPGHKSDLPLDVRGTAFQQKVWAALQNIRAGSTASYTDIATSIGKPKSVRAVALACGANPVAVAIPCHRVVRSDGALSGYRWGIERKRALLEREATSKSSRKK